MNYDHINVSCDHGIVTVLLNRPEKLNAFVGRMRRDLAEVLERATTDRGAHVIVIRGEGRAFCTGADVGYLSELMAKDDIEEFTRLLGAGRRVLNAIRQMPKPVIAAINGPAYGAGFNLALACDIRIAARSASFSQSFINVGLHPDWGATYFLPRAVPSNIACEMFFLGDAIDSEKALSLGLVNRVVADDELDAEVHRWAVRLRDAPHHVIGAAKIAVYTSQNSDLESMLQYETEAQLACFESPEAREKVRAFLEKRSARAPKA
jgi:2-(1,2-epoxy-1,2-dihydrophenyl)acetyl-CoA isomerase